MRPLLDSYSLMNLIAQRNDMPYLIYMVYLWRLSLSPISITGHSPFDIRLILSLAVVPIVLVVILCGEILYATIRSVHHMDELLRSAAWQTFITV